MSITHTEYWKEVKSIAANLIEENKEEAEERGDCVLELINNNGSDCVAIDSHRWIIHYGYDLDVIQHSDNEDYMVDNLGEGFLVYVLEQGGLKGLHQAIAHHAMLTDVQEELRKLGK